MNSHDRIADALDIVNCARYFEDIKRGSVYLCPVEGSAYNHKPCRFFGMYRNKKVEAVAEIEAVVDVSKDLKAEVLWENSGQSESQLQKTAIEKARRFRPQELPLRVFILTNITPTDFEKDTKGGMYGSKQYFDVSPLKAKDAKDLAAKLEGRQWSEFKFYSWK
jgi:hypothetical protein